MNEDPKAVIAQPAAVEPEVVTTPSTQEDTEARIAQLEADKAKAIEEAANYKLGMLKAKAKLKDSYVPDEDETEDERIARIVQEKISETKIAQIDTEKEALYQKILKENKELKLANMNKTTVPPQAMGTHTESPQVRDTLVTPEQLVAFKARGWTDKDIERYKKAYLRQSGR